MKFIISILFMFLTSLPSYGVEAAEDVEALKKELIELRQYRREKSPEIKRLLAENVLLKREKVKIEISEIKKDILPYKFGKSLERINQLDEITLNKFFQNKLFFEEELYNKIDFYLLNNLFIEKIAIKNENKNKERYNFLYINNLIINNKDFSKSSNIINENIFTYENSIRLLNKNNRDIDNIEKLHNIMFLLGYKKNNVLLSEKFAILLAYEPEIFYCFSLNSIIENTIEKLEYKLFNNELSQKTKDIQLQIKLIKETFPLFKKEYEQRRFDIIYNDYLQAKEYYNSL